MLGMVHVNFTPLMTFCSSVFISPLNKLKNQCLFVEHPWIKEGGEASDKPIDSAVLSRMKQFRAMNKLKKLALKVSQIKYMLMSACELQGSIGLNTFIRTPPQCIS